MKSRGSLGEVQRKPKERRDIRLWWMLCENSVSLSLSLSLAMAIQEAYHVSPTKGSTGGPHPIT